MNEFIYEPTGEDVWKYVLEQDYSIYLGRFWKDYKYKDDYLELSSGILTCKKGYAWNGLTCFPDKKRWLSASLVHDALLGENREKLSAIKYNKKTYKEIHKVFYRELLNNTNKTESWFLYWGVRLFHPLTLLFK